MKSYLSMSREELQEELSLVNEKYREAKEEGLSLDMSRGKPAPAQLDLTMPMLDTVSSGSDPHAENGLDCRNYGGPYGIPEARRLMAEIGRVSPDNVIVFGGASLNIMFDTVSRSFTHGVAGQLPWAKQEKIRFLCPAPGYDRHFRITEYFGVEMILIPMKEDGPDMDLVEEYVNNDPAVKGIWCVPKYSNPLGIVYSEKVVKRFARLRPAAPDFRIFWDDAYTMHKFMDDPEGDAQPEILKECEEAGNPDLAYKFFSTSKISFAGSGLSAMAASAANLAEVKRHMAVQIIAHDKLNQLRHVRFFKDRAGVEEHMRRQAEILRPKFECVLSGLERELGGLGIAAWTNPKGGYFVSFDGMKGTAKAIVAAAKEAGVTMTPAGATYPYGIDPDDTNIRIAPSYPDLPELREAVAVFTICVKKVTLEKLLAEA